MANLELGMERIEGDADIGHTAPPTSLTTNRLTQELAPHIL